MENKYLMLWVALISVLCIVWALTIPDFSMVVLLGCAVIYCIYAHFKLTKS